MILELKLRKVGNSVGVILPKEALAHLNVEEGDSVTMTEGPEGSVRLSPHKAEVARQMAAGVRTRFAATYGLAVTGVAGPDPQAGHVPGEVYVALAGPGDVDVERVDLDGDRRRVREGAVRAALRLAGRVLDGEAAR